MDINICHCVDEINYDSSNCYIPFNIDSFIKEFLHGFPDEIIDIIISYIDDYLRTNTASYLTQGCIYKHIAGLYISIISEYAYPYHHPALSYLINGIPKCKHIQKYNKNLWCHYCTSKIFPDKKILIPNDKLIDSNNLLAHYYVLCSYEVSDDDLAYMINIWFTQKIFVCKYSKHSSSSLGLYPDFNSKICTKWFKDKDMVNLMWNKIQKTFSNYKKFYNVIERLAEEKKRYNRNNY